MFVLGEEEGMKLAEERGMAVCFLRRDESGEIVESMTEGFRERIRVDE